MQATKGTLPTGERVRSEKEHARSGVHKAASIAVLSIVAPLLLAWSVAVRSGEADPGVVVAVVILLLGAIGGSVVMIGWGLLRLANGWQPSALWCVGARYRMRMVMAFSVAVSVGAALEVEAPSFAFGVLIDLDTGVVLVLLLLVGEFVAGRKRGGHH